MQTSQPPDLRRLASHDYALGFTSTSGKIQNLPGRRRRLTVAIVKRAKDGKRAQMTKD
jgi:hypothetical protein